MERFGPTRRGGPVFRWLGEPLAIDLANTVMLVREGEAVDLIADREGLERWLEGERDRLRGYSFPGREGADLRALRDVVRRLFAAVARGERPDPDDVAAVNAASGAAPVSLQLDPSGDHAHELDAPGDPVARLLGAVARSAIELLAGSERERLHLCDAPSCGMFFVGARRWCCTACGNRARVARHYRRTHSAASG